MEGRTVRGSRGAGPARKRPRFTGRAAVLLLVVLVLAVSYASSMRAYFDQRAHIQSLKSQIADSKANIAELEREKRRWDDPAYVRAQARSHLGYLMPGETGYQVLDENGNPLDSAAELSDPEEVLKEEPTAWWETVWGSVELAGDPPPSQTRMPAVIDGVKKSKQEKQ